MGTAAALTLAAAGAASAAPSVFVAKAVHSGGAGATAVSATGSLDWSTSLKTVTLANVKLFVKGGECGHLLIAGYQNPIGTVSQTAEVAGGIQELEVFAVDDSHDVTGYADCYQVSSVCLTGQF
ncbi:hypothetical protein [Amycolatopsis eburnea]|uniref:Secreted protein n=1 Tax=Amycolatopsis eburnea TaxID=2267691 RepID=A0A3R9DXN0_9PSEU|nr:hypothetical protein [Amycolatopsis eburnea]RSD19480.1 hypothetical protein EIY87_14340 [Amycolatopsis eburnea]